MVLTSPNSKNIARLMVFIDGGYLRQNFKQKYSAEYLDFKKTIQLAKDTFNQEVSMYQGDLIRAYYYDAIVDVKSSQYDKQKKYFDEIQDIEFIEVRLGRLVNSENSKTFRQKGVDVRLASDMITKAYQNHYDFAILFAGDDDFSDVINAVKDAGKRVIGIYFKDHVSTNFKNSIDIQFEISDEIAKVMIQYEYQSYDFETNESESTVRKE
jgi:uncharacterized LabA/DUF88 family protein